MKILEITHLYPVYYDLFAGIAIHKQIKTLKSKGCEVLVISPIPWTPFPIKYMSNKWKKYSKIPCYNTIEGIKVFHPRYLSFPKAYFLASSGIHMHYSIKKLVEKLWHVFPFDLIHAHMVLPDGYAGMLLSMDYNKPLIVTIRGMDIDYNAKNNLRCFKSMIRVFNKASQIISPSIQLSNKLKYNFNIIPININNGIDPKEIYCGKSKLYQKYRNCRILLSVSRLLKSKGIDYNLYAIKKLITKFKRIVYLIVGDGSQCKYLKNLVRDLDLIKNVEFIGHLSHEKVMEYMSICEIFSMPSWQETFGLVYAEAMAHGKPIVGCEGQGVDGIVKNGETGMLAKPKDVDSLVEALNYLLSNPNKAKSMGERARKLVLENYTWEKNAEKTINIYKEAICDNSYNKSISKTSFIHPRDRTSRACP
jgi:glycosyltransferase involved in cell wall biosynthesis